MSVTQFRELLCKAMLQRDEIDEGVDTNHYLRETQLKEAGKRADRRVRRYCVGCYDRMSIKTGRNTAKLKAKRVTTECSGCPGNPRFCYDCFAKFHSCKLRKIPDIGNFCCA